ncbi:hypothetical protein [Enterobacter kobei]|uniref:hypothetical protein n=1 Tax=Enterobacter kobei TaxID=208224 RepID=UPI003CE9D749
MMTKQENSLQLLSEMIKNANDGKSLFTNWRQLLGFQIGWLEPTLAERFCLENDLDTSNCEIIMMQATGRTECHAHQVGSTVFMALGSVHGFRDPQGGTLFGDYLPGEKTFSLKPERASSGEMFTVEPGKIHAFFADSGGELTAIGIVSPKIMKGEDEFDAIKFKFINDDTVKLSA